VSSLRDLALRIFKARRTEDEKILLLSHLQEGGDKELIEAELDRSTLFLGFKPAAPDTLQHLISGGLLVIPRDKPPTDPHLCINTFNKLKNAGRPRAIILYKTPWIKEEAEIVWYSFFTDRVSLRFCDGYKVIDRKELLNGGPKQDDLPREGQ